MFAWPIFSLTSAFSAFSLRGSCLAERVLICAGNTQQFDPPILFSLNGTQQQVQSGRENEPLSTYAVGEAVMMDRVQDNMGRGPGDESFSCLRSNEPKSALRAGLDIYRNKSKDTVLSVYI